MSVRLTNDLRDDIQKALIKHKFEKPLDKLADKRAKFALKVYNDVFTKKDRDLMDKCPDGWLSTDDDMNVQFGGDFTRLSFNGDQSRYRCHNEITGKRRDRVEKIVPKGGSYSRCHKNYDVDHKLTNEHVDLQREEQDLHDEIHKAKAAAKAALHSVNTLKQLLEVWPEIESFVPEYVLRQAPKLAKNLPALPIGDLNKSFGLPVKKAV